MIFTLERFATRGRSSSYNSGWFKVDHVETSHEPYSLNVVRRRHGMRTVGWQLRSVR